MEVQKVKPRTLLVLLALAVLAVALCFALARSSSSSVKAAASGKPFEGVQVNDSAKLLVKDSKGEAVVEKSGDLWVVPAKAGYPADFAKVSSLIRDLAELKATQSVPGAEAFLERFGLLPPDSKDSKDGKTGLDIQVLSKDGKALCFLRRGRPYKQASEEDEQQAMMMGRDPSGSARFVFLPDSKSVIVAGNPLAQASVKPSDWLDKAFVKIGELQKISLSEDGKESWSLSKKGSDWALDGEIPEKMEFDKANASSASSSLSWLSFSDVEGKLPAKPELGLDKPKTLLVDCSDGFSFKFSFGTPAADGKLPATLAVEYKEPAPRQAPADEKPEDKKKNDEDFAKKVSEAKEKAAKWAKLVDGWIYLFDKYSFEKLLVSRDKLLKAKEEKKPEGKDASADPLKEALGKANPLQQSIKLDASPEKTEDSK